MTHLEEQDLRLEARLTEEARHRAWLNDSAEDEAWYEAHARNVAEQLRETE